jgi:hypothetical protein
VTQDSLVSSVFNQVSYAGWLKIQLQVPWTGLGSSALYSAWWTEFSRTIQDLSSSLKAKQLLSCCYDIFAMSLSYIHWLDDALSPLVAISRFERAVRANRVIAFKAWLYPSSVCPSKRHIVLWWAYSGMMSSSGSSIMAKCRSTTYVSLRHFFVETRFSEGAHQFG